MSQRKSTPTVTCPATVELVEAHPFGPQNGAVYVYLVTQEGSEFNISPFYIATFNDDNTELVWGQGNSVKESLKDAEEKWNKVESEFDENPFTKALLEITRQEEWRWE